MSSTCSKLEGIIIASSSSDDQVNNDKESEVRRELLRERRTSGLSERSYVSDNISGEERVEEWSEGSGSIFFSSEHWHSRNLTQSQIQGTQKLGRLDKVYLEEIGG